MAFRFSSFKQGIRDFVANSSAESRDSSCEKSWVPVQNCCVPVQKAVSPKFKMRGPLCKQTVNLKTDSKTLYYSILKLEHSPFTLKHNEGYKKYSSLNNSHNNCHSDYTNRIIMSTITHVQIDRSLHPTGCMPWIILCLWGFLCVRHRTQR